MLYIPGLTYYEMVTYAAKLRMNPSKMNNANKMGNNNQMSNSSIIRSRVNQVMKLMNLIWCKDRLITERPTTRGTLGGELRKLSIAVEIINLPPVILLDDITRELDALVSAQIMDCLITLTEKGHTVICALPKPPTQVYTKV
jgi:ABC-type multidrug transport system ATPase subunit